ncbi:LuxR family transcriptional regulator [Mucilaginibacter pedocola]|uniref:LuxR family transcriptional regulator n=2 Tax=Mucilaginibacter pedocola TaxID=1792845 RepID=A0A1S9P942_9SPHI|nr:LuxR family transcriptional regulator [Mucilaginibacter pedocola]
MDRIHPDDKPYFLGFEAQAITFFKRLPVEKIKNYKAQYDLRLRNKSDGYNRILIQYVASNYDGENFYHSFHVHTDISHIKPEGIPCFSLIGLDGEPSFYNIQSPGLLLRSADPFTKREREVLKCIVEGNNTRQIAERLFISLHTVSTHRKNILAKAAAKTPVELVSKAINEGWI